MGMVKDAMGDLVLTAMWIFSMPISRISPTIVLTHLGVQPNSLSAILANTFSASLLILTFSLIGKLLGGASFNPSTSVAFLAAGHSSGASLLSTAVKFPAQAAGGVAGVRAVLSLVPAHYTAKMRGPSLKVGLQRGAFVEGGLTFAFCISVLVIVLKAPGNPLLKIWALSLVTFGLAVVGSGFTGPSINPANAFGWAFVNNTHDTWQHFYVYWLCPLIGAVLAGFLFRALFPKPVDVEKDKKA